LKEEGRAARPEEGEQRVILYGVPWERYVAIRELLEENRGVRVTYLKGAMEIMSPSPAHEVAKTMVARLIEMWAVERGVDLRGFGSTTFRKQAKERGLEPDECYVLGDRALEDRPDIAIEVVITSGGLDKLAVYSGLRVPEVWFWQDGRFTLHRLVGESYERIDTSTLVPTLDLTLLASYVHREDQTRAVAEYRDALRSVP